MLIRIILLFGLLCNQLKVSAQAREMLMYTNEGMLRIDTSFSISQDQIVKWRGTENLFIERLIRDVTYSQMATDYDVNGILIVSFDIDSLGNLVGYVPISRLGGSLEEIVFSSIKKFGFLKLLAPTTTGIYTYYLAFDFQLVDAKEAIEKNHAIPVTKVKFEFVRE